jgi:PAS domain S-box-containing protein
MNQPIPQSVALLLSESQRKEKKKNAKRVANRKSASTSRARKKALVEDMTKTNARLKRQALILALLPDLVITTNTDGDITFCSAQVERILNYNTKELLGAKFYSLLVPASQDAFKALVEELVNPGKAQALRAAAAVQARRGKKRRNADVRNSLDTGASSNKNEENVTGNSNSSARNSSRTGGGSSGDTSGAAVVSEQSFPLSVVEVESKRQTEQQQKLLVGNESNNSGGKCVHNDGTKNSLLNLLMTLLTLYLQLFQKNIYYC